MYEFAPPGRGYAYGETIPIFNVATLTQQPRSFLLVRHFHAGCLFVYRSIAASLCSAIRMERLYPGGSLCASGPIAAITKVSPSRRERGRTRLLPERGRGSLRVSAPT